MIIFMLNGDIIISSSICEPSDRDLLKPQAKKCVIALVEWLVSPKLSLLNLLAGGFERYCLLKVLIAIFYNISE